MIKGLCVVLCMLLISGIALLASCSSEGQAGEINVYNWGEYISNGEDGSMDVIAEFERQYGIKVNYTNYETNGENMKHTAPGLKFYNSDEQLPQ